MCGIVGKLRLRDDEPVTGEAIARMCAAIRHRGPDDEGIFLDAAFGMGMRRLSIIDLNTGKQPIANEDGSIWTVFNGEIYNFPELRAELEAKGHHFSTRTDTEVIVHLYEEHGEAFVGHLTGMFGIAVWDKVQRKLVLARDRLGIKPLYYHLGGEQLLFASEIKAILEEDVDREIDLQALHDYLSLNYVPGPRSIFREIQKLPPGHTLTASARGVTVAPYWKLTARPIANGKARSEESYREELVELLKTTVSQHLLSDVPLGVFLSGGVDSGTLVALMSEVASQRIQTFSIGFREQSYDELALARTVAERFGTDHHELVIDFDVADLLAELARTFDEPFADSSAIPVHCVSKLAREHVKVALSGEGGDEVFAGYETYAAYRVAELYRRLPRFLSAGLIPALVRSLPVSHRRVSFDYKARRFVEGALRSPVESHYWWKVIFTEDAKAALYARGSDGCEDPLRLYREAFDACDSGDTLRRLQQVDLEVYLPDDLLVKADRMSMAHSLEVRVPFLDHRVVEFGAALPPELKLRGLTKKYLLRRAMAGRLPPAIVRGKKRGFNVPMPVWIGRELRDLVHDMLGPRALREVGLFDPAAVARLIDDHEQKRMDYSRNIYGLLVFMLWHERYARRSARDTSPPLRPAQRAG